MIKKYTIVLILLILVISIMPSQCLAVGTTYYVDTNYPTASDTSNNGLTMSTPFKTIKAAADIMRAGDTCKIKGGTYRETVTPKYSGDTISGKITYTKYDNDTTDVIINGADKITTAWTQHSGNIYKTTITLPLGSANQIFVDSTMNNLARWPNNTGTLFQPTLKIVDSGTATTITDAELTQSTTDYWKGATIWCAAGVAYSVQPSVVSAFNPATRTLTFPTFNATGGGYNPTVGNTYYLEGLLSELDVAKEWYYNTATSTLYLYKQGGGDPTSSTVEYKKRNFGFDLSGRWHIDIKGIKLFATGIQTNTTSSYCTIDGITASYVMHRPGNIYDSSGYGGIQLKGINLILKNSTLEYSSDNIVNVMGSNNSVINNIIRYGDYHGRWDSNLMIKLGSGHLISHNTIYDAGRACVGLGNYPGDNSALQGVISGMQFQYNNIYNAGYFTKDLGVLYTGNMDGANSRIHHNWFHDNYSTDLLNAGGLYIDNHNENWIIDHNVIWGCPQALKLNTPSNSTLAYNNTLIGTEDSGSTSISRWGGSDPIFSEDMFASKIYNNLCSKKLSLPVDVPQSNNLYYYTDPLYVDAAAHNYRLTSASQAIDKGMVISGITDGYVGLSPDIGAYEYNAADWTAGHNFQTPPTPTFENIAAPYTNLVKNANFESNTLANWSKTGAFSARVIYENAWGTGGTGVVRRNFYGLRLGGTALSDGITQTITGLTPNTTYVASAWLKAGSGATIEINATNFGGTSVNSQTTSTSWIQNTCEFKTGSTNTTADIAILKSYGSMSYCYADVVTVVPKENLTMLLLTNTGIEDNFPQADGYIPTPADGWSISDLVAGDSVSVQGNALKVVKSGATAGTMTLIRNNLNLDVNAGGKILVEFEAQFPDLVNTIATSSFPSINCIKEDDSKENATILSNLSNNQVWTYSYTRPAPGTSQGTALLWSLDNTTTNPPATWHKMTYIIDTDADTFSAIRADSVVGTSIRLTDVGFSTNSAIKSISSLTFKNTKVGTKDSVYYIKNLRVIPMVAPALVNSNPVSGTALEATQNNIILDFNRYMDVSTLTNANITVSKGLVPTALTNIPTNEYSIVPIFDGITGNCREISINFTKRISDLSEYKVMVNKNVKSLGDSLKMLNDEFIYITPTLQLTAYSLTGADTTNITASVSLKNYKEVPQEVDFVVAVYDKTNGKLINIGKTSQIVESNVNPIDVPLSLTLPSAGTNYTIKGYLWDYVSNLKPLKTIIPFQ